MDESDRQDESDSPHIHFQTNPKPQHYQPEQQQQQGQLEQSFFPSHGYRRHSAGEGSLEASESDQVDQEGGGKPSQSTPPPVLSSTTTSATTPASTTTSSTPEHGHLSSPRALLRSTAGKHCPATPSVSAQATASGIDADASITQTYSTAPSTDVPADPSLRETVASTLINPSSSDAHQPALPLSSSALVSIKLLVSNNVAGSIIGRSGQTISDLQVQSSSRIKLSQSGDFYPGTSDRVCLVQGAVQQVKLAIGMVLQKIYDLQRNAQQQVQVHSTKGVGQHQSSTSSRSSPDNAAITATGTDYDAQHVPSFSFVVRILVPTPCCGMLIGRGGSNIKSMAESSGVTTIRLSPKESESGAVGAGSIGTATSERIVTITGPDLASTVSCVGLVIDGMASHPEIGRYANMTTSYSRALSAASAAAALQGPQAGFALSPPVSAPSSSVGTFVGSAPMVAPGGFVLNPPSPSLFHQRRPETSPSVPIYSEVTSDTGRQPHPLAMHSQSSHHQQQAQHVIGTTSSTTAVGGSSSQQLRYAPFSGSSDESTMLQPPPPPPSPQLIPTSPAISLPSLQPGSQGASSQHGQQSIYVVAPQTSPAMQSMYSQPSAARPSSSRGASRQSSHESLTGSASALMSATDQFASLQLTGSSSASGDGRFSQTQPGGGSSQEQPATMQIAVPDTLIGAILGRGGQTLTELQTASHTRIKISQRGVFVPGTNHRVVTITGPNADSVSTAHYLIGQRLARSGLRIGTIEQPMVGSAGIAQHQYVGLQPVLRQDSQEIMPGPQQYQQQQQQGLQQQSPPSHEQHRRQSSTERTAGAPSDSGKSRH